MKPQMGMLTAAALGAAAAIASHHPHDCRECGRREAMTGDISKGVITKTADIKGLQKTGIPGYVWDVPTNVPPVDIPAVGMAMRKANRVYSISDAKKMMALSVREAWPVVKKYFQLEDWQQDRYVALLLGQTTRETTLVVDIETGVLKSDNKTRAKFGELPSHAYGLLQTAVTAFRDPVNPYGFEQEDDVPDLYWYEWKAEHFYDPQISNYMGLRKMCHFALQAKNKYKMTDKWEILRAATQAHNTGHADRLDPSVQRNADYLANYPDNCAKMGEFYFRKGHMADDVKTWTDNFVDTWKAQGAPSWNTSAYDRPVKGAAWRDNWRWFWQK